MHFHILGVGPIGSLLAHNLRRILPPAHSISLIHKTVTDHHRFLEKGSLTVERAGVLENSNEFLHEVFPEVVPKHGAPPGQVGRKMQDVTSIDSVFVTLKAQHTIPALKVLAHRLHPNSTVVLLQNGMGIYEKLLNNIFRNPSKRPHFILASNTHGAFVTTPYNIVHAGVGSIEFGIAPDFMERDYEAGLHDEAIDVSQRRLRLSDISPPEDTQLQRYRTLRSTVAALLLLESLNASWKPFADLQMIMRQKLVTNAVINPLTALLGCRNGDLFAHPEAQMLSKQICDEAHMAYASQMHHETQMWLEDLEAQEIDTSNVQVPIFPEKLTSESLQKEVVRVAEITKGNVSSMLRDVRRGRRTEIEFINGYLVDLGYDHGIEMPANSTLLNLVKLKHSIPLDPIL